MKTKITITLLAAASLLFATNVAYAQATGNNTYNAANYIGWSAASGDLPFKISTTMMTLKNTTGYLGIGTTTPLGTLDVFAATNAPSWTYLRGDVNATKPSSTFSGGGLGIGWNYTAGGGEVDFISNKVDRPIGGFRFQDWNPSGAGTLTDLMTIQAGGNVGIGTTLPTALLDVKGFVRSLAVTTLVAPTTGKGVEIVYRADGVNDFGLIQTYDRGGATYKQMRLDASSFAFGFGNVGIGTTSPAQKLDIAGTAQMTGFKLTSSPTSGYVLTSDASGAGSWQPLSATISGSCSSGANYVPKMASTTAITCSQIYDNGTNVGIGTTTPSYKFHVVTTAAGDQAVRGISTAATTSGVNYGGYFEANGVGANENIGLYAAAYSGILNYGVSINVPANGIDRSLVSSGTAPSYFNGSVGIGYPNPGSKLDVNGTSNFNGNMAITGNVAITVSGSVSGTWTSSDQMFKTNIDSIHNVLATI
ncbi:MAG: hypothetical protein K8R85_14895, partial [Bacteroidetes bacterium]|nr:hypothetical protein [Bacteroidota bacterium]